ncbi:MAG TPA: methionine--tRNA ligase subunit beta, partial [Flavobacteriaceae bacterium]|nr:methionine--tRNA ligase subunit beta [Flavobacteriaceae bacterium]
HFIGKDNIVFHCIIFPVMLKAQGDYILPDNVPANEFLNLEGDKISTSRNWAVWLHEYLEDFPGKQDVLRYVLNANAPETKDNNFSWKDFQTRNNSELVGILGNFINRVMVLTHNYYGGIVPKANDYSQVDKQALQILQETPQKIGKSIERFRFREAQATMMNLARLGNKYLADEEPWKLIKTDEERVKTIMNTALQIAAALVPMSEPFIPFTSKKLAGLLNMEEPPKWNDPKEKPALLEAGHKIDQTALLFSKVEDEEIEKQLAKLKASKKENQTDQPAVPPQKEEIVFDDFTKLDLRVGEILEAEKIPKAKKLLKFKVDTGIDHRTIVSGIAEQYKPEELIGKKVSVIVNLKPVKLRGVLSEGMILMTESKDGKLVFVNPGNNMENGAIIK